jgi:hypothetical protein
METPWRKLPAKGTLSGRAMTGGRFSTKILF